MTALYIAGGITGKPGCLFTATEGPAGALQKHATQVKIAIHVIDYLCSSA